MPSVITHAVAGAGLGGVFGPAIPKWVLVAGAICATLPDVDAVGFWLGVPYDSLWGHRGLSHSIAFAAASTGVIVALWARHSVGPLSVRRVWLYLFAAMTSHGLLDMLTNGGRGVALLAPFSDERFFFPMRPIAVAPISVRRFFSARGWVVLRSEMLWVWLPICGLVLLMWLWQRRGAKSD